MFLRGTKLDMRLIRYICFLIVVLFTGCEYPIDLELEEAEPQIVVLCTITPDEHIKAGISLTRSVVSNSPFVYPEDAIVEIFSSNTLLKTLERVAPGMPNARPYYESLTFFPSIGNEYKLKVDVPGVGIVEATDVIPPPIDFEIIMTDLKSKKEGKELVQHTFTLDIMFNDQVEEENYYQILPYWSETIYSISINTGDTSRFASGARIPLQLLTPLTELRPTASPHMDSSSVLLNDELINGSEHKISLQYSLNINASSQLFDNIVIDMRSISKKYYQFYEALNFQILNGNDPLAEPSILYTNFENGQGVFAGYSTSRDSLILDQ